MGRLGIFLLRVVFWAGDQLARRGSRPRDRALRCAAHASLAGVTIIGTVIDALAWKLEARPASRPSKPSTA